MTRASLRLSLALTLGLVASACDDDDPSASVDAAASADALAPDGGAPSPDAPSPDGGAATDTAGPDGGSAITFKVRLENVAPFTLLKSGSYNTAVGAAAPGPLAPGQAYELTFTAGRGHRLSFASMFGASNDWIFATAPGGLDLYPNDMPVTGDVTAQVGLWDVGTEVDEEPAVGPHTGPKQGMSTDGPGAVDPNDKVRPVPAMVTLAGGATFNVPAVAAMIKVTITPDPATRAFKLRIENVSSDTATLMTSEGAKPVRVSPGVWALTAGGDAFFSAGKPNRGLGLEAIAESGNITALAAALPARTGLATGISPGVTVVHASGSPLFMLGQRDRGQGLETIAESGNIMGLAAALAATPPAGSSAVGQFTTPVGAMKAGPAGPGAAYELEVRAVPGDRLSFVTMYGWSNDWFFGTPETGIALFDAAGAPVTGDLSAMLKLYDAGTELSEEPAVGANTGPQQTSPTAGPADSDANVREVAGAVYATPVASHLKLTISR